MTGLDKRDHWRNDALQAIVPELMSFITHSLA